MLKYCTIFPFKDYMIYLPILTFIVTTKGLLSVPPRILAVNVNLASSVSLT